MKKVREGYKMTELGEIPNEWEVKKLKDLGNSIIGLTYSPDDLVDEENGTLVLRSSNIRNNRIVFDDNKYVNKDIQEKLIVKENDILICSRNGSKELIGKCALIDKKVEGSSFGAFMTIYRSNYNKYLFNVFTSYMFKRQIYNNLGATINQITTDNLNNFKIIVPTINEQEKIASILSTVDEQIDNVNALIEKNKELKKGLMQTLLTKGIGHTKFKKTEIGEIPEEWEIKQLGDIAQYINGKAFKPSEWNTEGLPIVRIQNLNGSKEFNYYNGVIEDKFIINKGQLLFSWSGSKGTSFGPFIWNNKKAVLNQHIFKVNLNESVDSFYGYYALKQVTQIIEESAHGSAGLVHVTKGTLEKFKIGVPKNEEQIKIASILLEVDEKIEKYENKKQKLEQLKKGLMQQLLTGKIRVV